MAGHITDPTITSVLRGDDSLRAHLRSLKLVNYFPARDGWQYMWTRWNPSRIAADFAILHNLGANAVRVTIFPAVTGFPDPHPLMQSRLAQVIELAADHGLRVQLSIFDQFTAFSDITNSEVWARKLLKPLAGNAHIAFIDLRNELDTPQLLGRREVLRWVDRLLPAVQREAPGTPVSLSLSHPENLRLMRDALQAKPDFWNLHYYSPDGLAYTIFQQAINAASPLPVFVGETGFATSGDAPAGLPSGQEFMEAYQAHYYQVIERAALSLGLGYAAPWILYDFSEAAIPGHQRPAEYTFGLLRLDQAPKPAAAVIDQLFYTDTIDLAFNNNFSEGFRTGHGYLPALWRIWQPDQADFGWDPVVGHDQPGSARIANSHGVDGGMPAFYAVPVQPEVEQGSRYAVTGWARGTRATGKTLINITWFDQKGIFLSGVDSAPLPIGDAQWTKLDTVGVAPPKAAFAEIWLKSAHNSGTVWFDDIIWKRPTSGSPDISWPWRDGPRWRLIDDF
jgi:hypothetical protein